MQKYFVIILFLTFYQAVLAQTDSLQARIILIGDAGKLNNGRQPVVDAARKLISPDNKTIIVFLGDNLYKTGLPDSFSQGYVTVKGVLDSQINIAKGTHAKVVFIPGNHDWTDGSSNRLKNVKREEAYINNQGNKNVQFIPSDGSPGPLAYPVTDEITLIVYDSQWFIQQGKKPGGEPAYGIKTEEQFYSELDDLLRKNSKKLVILASHHTLKSYGIHGGYFTLKQHIFPFTDLSSNLWIPLPVVGSLYPIVKDVLGTSQDLHKPAYANMANGINKIAKRYPHVIFAGGHEHNLQLIKDSGYYYIVSGAGSKKSRVSPNKKLLYKAASFGFATLEISKNKNVRVNYYKVNKNTASRSFSKHLFNFSDLSNKNAAAGVPRSIPIAHFHDSVIVAINTRYDSITGLQEFISGKNYRKEWAAPVHLKVFKIERERGGFTIKGIEGGHNSPLQLIDKLGNVWALRTVDQVPEEGFPWLLKNSIAESLVQDMVSAQSPFGVLAIPALAEAAGVLHTNPQYYYVPDDPGLKEYRSIFANKVCVLQLVSSADKKNTKSTNKVIEALHADHKNQVDQQAVLRARLLDMLIGDWDRKFQQWQFKSYDTGMGKLYQPFPRERDQAFFNSNGILIKAASLAGLPSLQGFKKNYGGIKWFNWEERDFDRIFLNSLDADKWKRSIIRFQLDVNDSVIRTAVKGLPPEIVSLNGKVIADKLKSRRDLLAKKGMLYYRFLSREVNVAGSNKNEFFKILKADNGLEVKVYQHGHENDAPSVIYDRVFKDKETKFINLYGLSGADIFTVDSNARSKIKLRIIGGKGNDTFNINGNIRNKIYDYSPEKNFITNGNRTANKMSSSPDVNQYHFTGYKYNSLRLPLLSADYNSEDKVLIGLGFSIKKHAFRKEPYSTYQKLFAIFSYSSKSYQIKYTGEFNHLINKNDLVVHAGFFNPALNNFYGLGNLSKNDKTNPREFYHVRYQYFQGEVLLRKRYFNNLLHVDIGPGYFQYHNQYKDNQNKILGYPSLVGLDSASIYSGKSYLGGKAAVVINNLNNELLPTRGVIWNTAFSAMFGINKNSHPITKLTSDLQVYSTLRDPDKLVAVLRFGGGHIFNDNYEYFQALTIGDNNFLRGYRKNRFAGQSLLYQATELRVKLFESKLYIFPGAVGVIGFNEVGRVWIKGEHNHKWHHDFGGGFYYSAYNFVLLSATVAHSNESNLLNFSIGTKFNTTL